MGATPPAKPREKAKEYHEVLSDQVFDRQVLVAALWIIRQKALKLWSVMPLGDSDIDSDDDTGVEWKTEKELHQVPGCADLHVKLGGHIQR